MGDFMLTAITGMAPQARTIAFPRGRVALRAMPASAGVEIVTDTAYSWHGLKRGLTPFAVIQHTLSGEGRLDFEGRLQPMRAGETMLVSIPHAHRYYFPGREPWHFFYLVVSGQEALRLVAEVIAAQGPVLRLGPRALERLAGVALALLAGEAEAPGEASALAYRAVTALVDDVLASGPISEAGDRPDWLRRVDAHIEAHLSDVIGVERLADIAGMSRAHFVRQFTRHAGVPPSDYVFRSRMARAARLLQSTQLSIIEVALSCGFADPNYFAKAFRRAFEVSPSEFRRSGLFTSPEAPRLR